MNQSFENLRFLAAPGAADALGRIRQAARETALALPGNPASQETGIRRVIAIAAREIGNGLTVDGRALAGAGRVIRLGKEAVGAGRLKLQLFPLQAGEMHPPHAHDDLLSCQVVLAGRVRMREYSLVRRVDERSIEVAAEPVKILERGQGTFTLQYRNNIHWQEGLEPGTVLLNINWQGYLPPSEMSQDRGQSGRRHLDWEAAVPADTPGRLIVPELAA
ncbi:MAG: hypothetical protein AB7U38_02245 [Hyphomicrobiales bacterium]